MHYQHAFHAGNFADVWKHCILGATLKAMNRKAAAWSYLESHAGAGRYLLASAAGDGGHTPEWCDGIGRVLKVAAQETTLPEAVADYLAAVREAGPGCYPGSPQIALRAARADDQLLLCETQAPTRAALGEVMGKRAVLKGQDGYALDSALPPRHGRVVVLVDPPFNRPDEFDAMAALMQRCLKRCAHGVYLLWYPRKNAYQADRMLRRVARAAGGPVWNAAFDHGTVGQGRMHATGVAVVNPPYGLDTQLADSLAWLARAMARGPKAEHKTEWIAHER